MSNIFEKYPDNLNIEFDNSFKVLKENFSDEQIFVYDSFINYIF